MALLRVQRMEQRISNDPDADTDAAVAGAGGGLPNVEGVEGGVRIEAQGFAETKGEAEGGGEAVAESAGGADGEGGAGAGAEVEDEAAAAAAGASAGGGEGEAEGEGQRSSSSQTSVGVEYEAVARLTEAMSDATATAMLITSAEGGFARAQNDLGHMYEKGSGGLAMDESKAAVWYLKAAKQGLATAQYK